MAKKKKSAQAEAGGEASFSSGTGNGSPNGTGMKQPAGEPSTSALIICRNK